MILATLLSTGGGGLAGLGVICLSSQKGRGITGSWAPVGDAFDIDYVAHEMGHQFGANHTQNNDCNRNDATAAETGSGSTIMAYAGICAPNVQNFSDAYFHAMSIGEMTNRVIATSCASSTTNGNFAPVVNAGPDYTIPRGTPFILKGTGTDANNDALTYCWEQIDVEPSQQAPLNSSTNGPNFRSRIPSSSPERYMPRIQDVINNNLAPTWEVVPNVARTMNFALTVRDNRTPNGGQTNRDNMVVTTSSVGPFLVSAPNTAVSWVVGSNQNVTWTVSGTDANEINAAFVDILLSTDGGTTYNILLASKVPNDGSEMITVPNNPGTTNRIMVRGYKHIFYDISNTNFTITTAPSSFAVAFSGVAEAQNIFVCDSNTASFTVNYSAYAGFNGTTSFTATGAPIGSIIGFSPDTISSSGTVVMTLENLAGLSGSYQIVVNATSGGTTKSVGFYLSLGVGSVVLTTPANNEEDQNTSLNLSWDQNTDATSYDVEVATNDTISTIISSDNVTGAFFSVSGLTSGATYYWRVRPKKDTCDGIYSNTFQFTVGTVICATISSTNVPVAISDEGTPTITSTITIPAGASITDLNVILDISHTYISDLTVTLESPFGTVVTLFGGLCGSSSGADATFDDSGVAIICSDNPAISGTVVPAEPLSVFNNQNSTGTWTLTLVDEFNLDGGALNSWGLNICGIEQVVKWTGTTSDDWSTASNWSNNLIPNGTYNIEIPEGNPILATSYTIESGVNLKIKGTGSLTLSPTCILNIQGSADFGNLPVVLQSSETGSASLGEVSGLLLNATNVTVERFIPAKRAWRILAAPLTGASSNSITANWQGTDGEGLLLFSPNTFQTNTMVGYVTGGSSPNIRKYDGSWNYINNLTTEPIFGTLATNTKPFLVFVTGASDSNNIVTGAGETTLRPKGQLITGTVSHTNLATGVYHALANPYASAINPVSLLTNNPNHKLWLVDPSLGQGAYVTFDGANWSVPVTGNNAYIQSGQGFFVRSAAANSFVINETDKVLGSSNNWFEKNATTSTTTNADKIRVLLYKQLDNEWKLVDGTLSVNYAEGLNEVNAMDSNKISNFNESIMFKNSTSSLSIEHRALPIASEIQPIRITGTTALPYQLRVKTENYTNSTLLPVLEDTTTGTFTAIPTDGSEVVIPFTGAVSTSTNPDNRFRIVYQTNLSNVETSRLLASVFPNPVTHNQLNIHLGNNNEPAKYTITNLLGQVVQNGSLNNIQNVITIATANQGFYILNITQKGKLFTSKFFVKKFH